MYIINIKINPTTKVSDDKLRLHRQWFKKYFDRHQFLIVGPSKSVPLSGIIIATAHSKNELDRVISQDVFYPSEATYEIKEFQAKLVSTEIQADEIEGDD